MEKLIPNQVSILGSAPMEAQNLEESWSRLRLNQFAHFRGMERNHLGNHNSRMDFPYFEGIGVAYHCSWLRKWERYFHYNHILDLDQKLEEEVLHLTGKFKARYFSYQLSKGNVSWQEFYEELCRRFQDTNNSRFNLIGEFKMIEQKAQLMTTWKIWRFEAMGFSSGHLPFLRISS